MSSFDTVEIMFEFSKAIRHGLIALESLNDLDGVDRHRVSALTNSPWLSCIRGHNVVTQGGRWLGEND